MGDKNIRKNLRKRRRQMQLHFFLIQQAGYASAGVSQENA